MHYTLLVNLDCEYKEIETELEKLMEPHRERDDDGKVLGWWDWYVIGGRWSGYLRENEKWLNVKTNKIERPEHYLGVPGSMDHGYFDPMPNEACDIIRKKDFGGFHGARTPYSFILNGHYHAREIWTGKKWKTNRKYEKQFQAELAKVPDHHWLVLVDYHC